MKLDREVDEFVSLVNSGDRATGPRDEIPPSVATSEPDDFGYFAWQIRPTASATWVPQMESMLPRRLPPSYRSLITRYVFPAFEISEAFLFANTPEGTTVYELRNRLRDPFAQELLETRGLIQFANSYQYNYDPICFDANVKVRSRELPIVCVDHEDVLCHRRRTRIRRVADSFLELVRAVIARGAA